MKIDVITYKDELQQDLKSMLRDYLNLVAEEVKHDPWRFEVNITDVDGMGAFLSTEEEVQWDKDNGCEYTVYGMEEMTE